MISRILFVLLVSSLSHGAVKVVTTTTDLAWAAKKIGGDRIEVTSLLKGSEDPHHVDTIPNFILRVAEADVVCLVGLELEIGWIPKVLSRSGNAKVQVGGPGYCETGKSISVLEKPQGDVDRSMGDVHPGGNPHYWLSPKALGEGAKEIRDALKRVDGEGAASYEKGYNDLLVLLAGIQKETAALLKPLLQKKAAVMEYHREFSYFFNAYGLRSWGSLEEKPGVPPSAGRIGEVALQAKKEGVAALLAGRYAPEKVTAKFQQSSGVPVVIVSTSLEPSNGLSEFADFQKRIAEGIVKASGLAP